MKPSAVLIVLLLAATLTFALDPPVKLWEQQYYSAHDGCFFRDMELTPSEDLFLTGSAYDWTEPILPYYCAFLLSTDGDLVWSVEQPWYVGKGNDGAILPDSSFIITGRCVETPDSSYSLFIMKIDQAGSIEWTKIYDYPDTKEEGYGITCLPDGGFAVCGRVHGTGLQQGEAWILRTDAQGDTLWTRKWQSEGYSNSFNYGKSILQNTEEICMLSSGISDSLPTYGTHLLFYDLDGNFIRGTDYPTLYYLFPASICATPDGGYTFTTEWFPPVWHTDQYGETLWWQSIYVTPNDRHKGYCIRHTMDSGYIFSGWDGYFVFEPDGSDVDYEEGWLARFDSEGNELWNINNNISADNHFYSCLQLPEGGYMACGSYGYWENPGDGPKSGNGYLVRYAPETGIEQPEPVPGIQMSIYPNPCSTSLSVSFSQPQAGQVYVLIYDLSGKLISTVSDGLFPSGFSTTEWTVPKEISSGCYLARLETGEEHLTESFVLIR